MPDSTRSPAPEPYVAAHRSIPELTAIVVVLGVVLSIVLGAANAYLGLFVGMTVSASIPAAVVSLAVLRPFRGNILQNNAVQTAASAGEGLAAGVIFTVPALVLLGTWEDFHYIETTVLVGLGGVLGVLFTVPLRRALIIEDPLEFPEGVATAEVLEVGDAGHSKEEGASPDAAAEAASGSGPRILVAAGAIGAAFKLVASGFKLIPEVTHAATRLEGSIWYFGSNLSPALIGVGYIVGRNIAVLVFIGGVINWLVAIPIYSMVVESHPTLSAVEAAGRIWSTQTRYLGVGAMLVGGIWALVRLGPSVVRGVRASIRAYQAARSGNQELLRTERDLPMQYVLGGVVIIACALFAVFYSTASSIGTALLMTLFMVLFGFLFSAVAAYMAGLVGSSNNPISGVTIATVLTGALLLYWIGTPETIGPAAAIFIGTVVCSGAAIGGDNMQDLKAGYILGATPIRQQVMQIVGVMAAVFVMAPVLNLLHSAYTIGSPSLSAPQATLMSSVARGVFGGDLPWGMIAGGAGLAVVVIALDLVQERRKSAFRLPVLAVAVGVYLPLELSTPIFIGGMIAHFAERAAATLPGAQPKASAQNGLLFSAGLITGEALLGIALAVPFAVAGSTEVLVFASFGGVLPALLGLALLVTVCALSYRVASGGRFRG